MIQNSQSASPILEFTSLGGLKCELYPGRVRFPYHETFYDVVGGGCRTFVVKTTAQKTVQKELDAIGRSDHLYAELGNPLGWVRWVLFSKMAPSELGGYSFQIRWDDMVMDLSDKRIKQRLLTYLRYNLGWTLDIRLVQRGVGEVRVDIGSNPCSEETSLRRCLGLPV